MQCSAVQCSAVDGLEKRQPLGLVAGELEENWGMASWQIMVLFSGEMVKNTLSATVY